MELGYWGIKGRAHVLRMLIAYLGLDVHEWNPASPQDWQKRKEEFRKSETCYFPNLPYFKDGQLIITETAAIASALVIKANRQEMLG